MQTNCVGFCECDDDGGRILASSLTANMWSLFASVYIWNRGGVSEC